LSGARERRLEDVAATFDHGYSDYVGSWSRAYCVGVPEDQFILDNGVLYEAQKRTTHRSKVKSEAALEIKAM
jgi:hypothetical protein